MIKGNGCTVAALVSAMLNIINEVSHGGDTLHTWIGVLLAIATLVVIWRIDFRRNNIG